MKLILSLLLLVIIVSCSEPTNREKLELIVHQDLGLNSEEGPLVSILDTLKLEELSKSIVDLDSTLINLSSLQDQLKLELNRENALTIDPNDESENLAHDQRLKELTEALKSTESAFNQGKERKAILSKIVNDSQIKELYVTEYSINYKYYVVFISSELKIIDIPKFDEVAIWHGISDVYSLVGVD